MISSTILMLKKVTASSPNRVYPYYVHGWIYTSLRLTSFGQYYHEAQITPFAIKEIELNQEGIVYIHFIFLDYRVMIEFLRELYPTKKVRLGNDYYIVVDTAIHQEDHPKAGMVSYDSFYRLPIVNRLTMDFKYSAFSNDNKTDVLPVPDKVVRSLLNKWNATSPDSIVMDEGFIKQLASGMLITSHSIHTTLYQIRNDITLTTFSGKVVCENIHEDKDSKQLLNRLLHFSHYSGVGWKCSYGMGRVDVSPGPQLDQEDLLDNEVLAQ